jgi:hypothetical protein
MVAGSVTGVRGVYGSAAPLGALTVDRVIAPPRARAGWLTPDLRSYVGG